ncbi:MAG TPA: transglutaminase family protein [Deltaproteobacteria bacterium]|nr:transglutaminase family protein [Deltaproteobacteria bacterium]
MDDDMQQYLQPTPTMDFDTPEVLEFAFRNAGDSSEQRLQAVSLYYAVRDGIRYDPYTIDLSINGLKASTTLLTGRGWCVAKAILLAACCRAHAIPARLGYADVRNHLTTARMREQMKTDIFYYHGYTSIYINGKWLKATPAFNIELCEKFRLRPLEFDGQSDSIYHPFDLDGKQHMEYLRNRGEYADVPLDDMMETFSREYIVEASWNEANFDQEVDKETEHL